MKNATITDFSAVIHNLIQNNIKVFLHLRIILNNLKKNIPKKIASDILQNGNMLDITPKKIYKHISVLKFHNKALETTRLSKIFNYLDKIKTPPYSLQEKNSIPNVTYELGNTITKNILNYKDTALSIYIDPKVSIGLNNCLGHCVKSQNFGARITNIS